MQVSKNANYVIEVRIGSMRNDPVCQLESSSPFGSISVGDKFIHEGLCNDAWYDLPRKGEAFFVVGKAHIIAALSTGDVLHSIILCIAARNAA